MTENLSLLLHLFYIFSVSALMMSITARAFSGLFFRWVQKFNPKSKIILLRSFGVMPIIGAMIIGIMVSIPALNHNSLLPIDHCHSSVACLGEAATHMITFSELSIISLMLLVFFNSAIQALKQWLRSKKLLNSIELVSVKKGDLNIHLVETEKPLAFSIGMLKPISVISSGLMNQLSSKQLHIVCRHEAIHAQYKDSAFKWVLKFVSLFHFPMVKQTLLTAHASALEFRADQEVAKTVKSKIVVAETILKIQRIMGSTTEKETLCQFLGSEIEQRIRFLLSTDSFYHLTNRTILRFGLTIIICSLLGSVPLHNAVEILLTQ
tara:strand:- start:2448 stop:3413 length:966 start_codon:yes stop_codon:yes gene_type:complete